MEVRDNIYLLSLCYDKVSAIGHKCAIKFIDSTYYKVSPWNISFDSWVEINK